MTDPANFRLSFFVEILSSLQGIVSYRAYEDGTPWATQEEYLLENDFVLTLLQPMTFELADGGEKEFAAGTAFTFLATDGATWVDMLSDAGEQVRSYGMLVVGAIVTFIGLCLLLFGRSKNTED